MTMTNAEKQAAFRRRRDAHIRELEDKLRNQKPDGRNADLETQPDADEQGYAMLDLIRAHYFRGARNLVAKVDSPLCDAALSELEAAKPPSWIDVLNFAEGEGEKAVSGIFHRALIALPVDMGRFRLRP